jgi:hypothetical protein
MATAMSAEMSDNSQYSKRLVPESRNFTLNSSLENLISRIIDRSLQEISKHSSLVARNFLNKLKMINSNFLKNLQRLQEVFVFIVFT